MASQFQSITIAASLLSLTTSHSLQAENEWIKGVSLDGLVTIQGVYNQDYQDNDASDVIVHTAALGLTAQVNEWSTARISLIYEERLKGVLTPFGVDEAFITLGNSEETPVYLAIGQMYVPFGNFESNLVSYPLTYEVALTQEKAIQLGFESAGIYGSVYGFNGNTNDDNNDTIDHYGGNLGFARSSDNFSYDVGIGYINDIGDTIVIADVVAGAPNTQYDYVDGLSTHLILNMGAFSFIGEYITALDEFQADHFTFAGHGAEIQVWNTEVAFSFNAMGKNLTLAAGYQATEESLALQLPQSRILAALTMALSDNATIGLEYALDEDYDQADGGTGEDAETATLQLAIEF